MHFGRINIPEAITSELKDGRLVLFVGAGVSNPEPSGLPMFDELAKRIAEGTGKSQESREVSIECGQKAVEKEPIDRFLGRLSKDGVKVKQLARSILVGTHTKPNQNHKNLIRLFREPRSLRIVTTNFDGHLTTELIESHGAKSPVYSAPALPVGSEFRGLVYLHGSAETDPQTCVLTDEDFGRAYLTEGWARRFLVSMFGAFTVLFVGYSHNDPVMNYLSRGLPPDRRNRRFALVPEGSEAHWRFLDIEPISYPIETSGDRHRALMEGLERWAQFSSNSYVENVRRLTGIAEIGPPMGDPEEQDFVEASLKDVELIRPFVDKARNPEWITWLSERGLCGALFRPDAVLTDCERHLSWWLARFFIPNHTQKLLALIQRHGSDSIHSHLCGEIADFLTYRNYDDEVASVSAIWLGILVAQPSWRISQKQWAKLIRLCNNRKTLQLVGCLFERATAPEIQLSKRWSYHSSTEEDNVGCNVYIQYDSIFELKNVWENDLAINLGSVVNLIDPIITRRIIELTGLHQVVNSVDYDVISRGRKSIAPHPQDEGSDPINFLIDAARDILAHQQRYAPDQAEAKIKMWIESRATLLRRLAIHALASQPTITGPQKVKLCIAKYLLFDSTVRTEVYDFLQKIYGRVNVRVRTLLLNAIEAQVSLDPSHGKETRRPYEIFRLIGWLARGCPSCKLVKAKFQALQELHPEWTIGDHPELDSWSTGFQFIGDGEGVDIDLVLKKPAEDFLLEICAAPISGRYEERRENLCSALPMLIARDSQWGINCQLAASKLQIADEEFWAYMSRAWSEVKLSEEIWRELFEVLFNEEFSSPFWRFLPDMLVAWANRSEGGIPLQLVERMDELGRICWRKALINEAPSNKFSRNWLDEAVNHPGGAYARYLLLRLEAIRKSDAAWIGSIPEFLKSSLKAIVTGSGRAEELGRVVVAAQVRWLYSVDQPFVKEFVVPLFNWAIDERRAEQSWHGFLIWGHWSDPLVDVLLEEFTETVRRLGVGEDNESQGLGESVAVHLAGLCMWLVDDPMANDWLISCVRMMSVQNRRKFASEVKRHLKKSSAEEREKRWVKWMDRYIVSRTRGVPSVEEIEAKDMFEWAIFPNRHTPAVVEAVLPLAKVALFSHSWLLSEMQKSSIIDEFPTEAATLLVAFLEQKPKWFHVDEDTKKVWRGLCNAGVPSGLLDLVLDQLIRLGGELEDFTR